MKSLGWIHDVRYSNASMIVTTRNKEGNLEIRNISHHDWVRLLDDIGAIQNNEAIGRELIERLELMDPTEGSKR